MKSLSGVLIFALSAFSAQAEVRGLFVLEASNRARVTQNETDRQPAPFKNTRNPARGATLSVTVDGTRAWIPRQNMRAVRLDDAYTLRAAPEASARAFGHLRDAELVDDIVLTGRTGPGSSKKWLEVIFKGKRRWVSAKAVRGPLPPTRSAHSPAATARTEKTPRTADTRSSGLKPITPKPIATNTTTVRPAPAAKIQTPAPKNAAAPKTCISSEADALKSPRHRPLLERARLYRRWNGPAGAYVDVYPSGQGVFHHPWNGDKPVHVSICVTASNNVYIAVRGRAFSQNVRFTDQSLSTISVQDPDSQTSYNFR